MKEVYIRLQPWVVPLIPVKGILLPCVPLKVAFYAWEETLGRSLMLDKLQKRGWHLPIRCFLYGCEEEMVHHILLCCSIVRYLWGIICSLVGISWVFPKIVKDSLRLEGSFCGEKEKKDLEFCSIVHVSMWKERNCIAFKDGSLCTKIKAFFCL